MTTDTGATPHIEGLARESVGSQGSISPTPFVSNGHPQLHQKVRADGNHLLLGGDPFRVKGVTYGTFEARADGALFPESGKLKNDLIAMKEHGLNTVRTYTLPPVELLDVAAELDLKVIVGVDYLDWRYETQPGGAANRRVRDTGLRAVERALELCGGRPEVLALSVGNEVPVDVARTHGISTVERVLAELIDAVHSGDPEMLATYCNFPTTEFLQISGQDIVCLNVFLEDPRTFRRYIRHLQVVADDRPLILTELGLASAIHGEEEQAAALSWQLRVLDECGVAGATVFAWTDEWAVNNKAVEGWGFGVTDTERRPKQSLEVLRRWTSLSIADLRNHWPRVSVVICAYNAGEHIEQCLRSVANCSYPDLEVIVCDDGSTDDTLERARRFPFQVLELGHGGLSAARNAGIAAATGQIVAFLDSDAFCHPGWPFHLALSLENDSLAGTGGPNLPVENAGLVERAVAASPGGPIHVLVTDDRAEHVPGCNMAFRKSDLVAVEGFDPAYTTAGDDVDVCWKLLDAGRDISFSAAAQVRHHRRSSVKGYLKQQRGYGRAERMVAAKHPHRFNRLGQARWSGFIYGGPRILATLLRPLIYHGYQGMAPYQGVLHRRAEVARNLATAFLPLFAAFAVCGALAAPFTSVGRWIGVASMILTLAYWIAVTVAAHPTRTEPHPLRYRTLVGFFYLSQPIVRAWGRVFYRSSVEKRGKPPAPTLWTGERIHWLRRIENGLREKDLSVRIGGPHDHWDIETSFGLTVAQRLSVAVVWGWTPVSRSRMRLRAPAIVGTAALCVIAALGHLWPLVLLGAWAVVAVAETILVRRHTAAVLKATTDGSTDE
ncbi:MAG TPA: glycosyltransferase [Actinomycetota bacterium]|nr:glycosyltransferase [Actinomycetota bacterium]